jgi:4-amino-4-deoxy-L-arabinose transferase-like glycosyltransferase
VNHGAGTLRAFLDERGWLGLWVLLLAVPLSVRGPLPPDELRYLSVAWEMWSRGELVLPLLNGAPYADKPPLLFWLMHAGWALFGVNAWWPRLLPGLFALTAILLARGLCRALWPDDKAAISVVPWLLLGTLAWAIYAQALLFDLLLVNWTLLGLHGYARAERGDVRGWVLVAAAIGLGLLTKGPATLLHLGGPGLLVPLWARPERLERGRWYSRLGLALLAGCIAALGWATLAAWRGGGAYAEELLLGQTAGRLATSFAHARPVWFYIWIVPLLLFPWSLWVPVWRAVKEALPKGLRDRRWKFLLTAIAPAFVAFSVISGKQPHYLLPLVPLLVLLVAVSLSSRGAQASASIAFARRLALVAPVIVVTATTAFFLSTAPAYDLAAAASQVHDLESARCPIAYVGAYNGELHFLGRLQGRLEIIRPQAAADWAVRHPDGYLVGSADLAPPSALHVQRWRGKWFAIQSASQFVRVTAATETRT